MKEKTGVMTEQTASGDYHRYIFRDGRLLGQFERMYRESRTVPWKQDETADAWWIDVAVRVLQLRAPYGHALEVGCGLGYFTDKVAPLCRDIIGADVSATAVQKARAQFPHLAFRVLDIRKPARALVPFDLVIAKDIVWYVYPRLTAVMENLRALTAPGGWLFVFQCFPNLARPFIGKRVVPNPERLIESLGESFSLEYSAQCQQHGRAREGPMFMALLRKSRGRRP